MPGLGDLLEGFIPATIREVIERSKLTMLMHGRDKLTGDDLKASAIGLKAHADLLVEKEDTGSDGDKLAELLRKVVNPQLEDYSEEFSKIMGGIEGVGNGVDVTHGKIGVLVHLMQKAAERTLEENNRKN